MWVAMKVKTKAVGMENKIADPVEEKDEGCVLERFIRFTIERLFQGMTCDETWMFQFDLEKKH